MGQGGGGGRTDRWPVIFVSEPTNILGPGGDPRLTRNRQISWFDFVYHCLFWLPPRSRSLQNRQNIQVFIQMHNIVHDKQRKFNDYIVHDKRNQNQNYGKGKQRTTIAPHHCRRILPSGGRGCRQSRIPVRLVVILSRLERHVNEHVRNAKWTC
jgi:hypothetical protein